MATGLGLEMALAIGKAAGRGIEGADNTVSQIEGLERQEEIGELRAISADILDRGGADRAGNAGEVFQPRNALRDGPGHEIVPVFAGPGGHDGFALRPVHDLPAADPHQRDDGLEPLTQHHIAAAAENAQR